MKSKLEIITEQVKALADETKKLTKLMEDAEIGVMDWWQAVDSLIEKIKNDWMRIEL